MTLRELYDQPYRTISDYPKVSYPSRASVVARTEWWNEYGVPYIVEVLANRSKRRPRYWLEILFADEPRTIHCYRTTTSQKLAGQWIDAVERGWDAL